MSLAISPPAQALFSDLSLYISLICVFRYLHVILSNFPWRRYRVIYHYESDMCFMLFTRDLKQFPLAPQSINLGLSSSFFEKRQHMTLLR